MVKANHFKQGVQFWLSGVASHDIEALCNRYHHSEQRKYVSLSLFLDTLFHTKRDDEGNLKTKQNKE